MPRLILEPFEQSGLLIAGGGAVLALAALSWLTGSLTLGFALTCALAVTMIATMLLGSLLVKSAPRRCRCQTQQAHAAVNTDSLQGRAIAQGRWAKRFSPRRRKARPLRTAAPRRHHPLPAGTEHLRLLAQVELDTGAGFPDFVEEEFDAFLECGIFARGFPT